MRKYLALMFVLIFILSITITAEPAYATWWNTTWFYSKNITHTNYHTFAHSEQNVKVLFNHSGHASYATKCSDIRVVNSAGTEIISTNANTSNGSGNPSLICDSTWAEVVYNVSVGASTNINYTIYYGASGVGNTSYSKYPYYFNDTFNRYTSGYPLNTAFNGTYYVTNNGTLGSSSRANVTWNSTGGGYEGLQANVFSKSGGEASQSIQLNATNFTLMPNQSVNISFTWETFSKTTAATSRFAAMFSFLTYTNSTANTLDGYQIWQRQGDLNKNRLFRTFNINRSDADYTATPHPTELNRSYFDVDSVYGEKYKKWGYMISIWNASTMSNGNVNFTIDMYLDENGGDGTGGSLNMTYYVIDYQGYPKFGSFGWGAWVYTDAPAGSATQGWSKITNLSVSNSNLYNSTFYTSNSELGGYFWNTPTANISSGLSYNGIQFNSTLTNYTYGTVYNVTAYINNTAYTPTSAGSGVYYTAATLPVVTTATSISYYYTATVLQNGVTYLVTSPVSSVTVNPISVVSCGSAGAYPLIRFNHYNEESPYQPINTSMELSMTIWQSDREVNTTYNFSFASNRTHEVCINPSYSWVYAFAMIGYSNDTADVDGSVWTERNYYLDGDLLTNSTQTINLYSLNDTVSTTESLQVQDTYGNPVDKVLIRIQRYYIGENTYRTVAGGYTDTDGYAVTRLRLSTGDDSVFYRFILSRDGTTLKTTEKTNVIETTLLFIISLEDLAEYWELWNSVEYSCSYTNSTKILLCEWNDPTGKVTTASLVVKEQQILNTTNKCSQSSTDSSGVFTCDLSGMTDETYYWTFAFETDNVYYIVATGIIQNLTAAKYEAAGLFAAMVIVAFLGFAGLLYSVEASILLSIIGVVASKYLGLIPLTDIAIAGLVVAGAILIWRVSS
jgi:hypothetical protein